MPNLLKAWKFVHTSTILLFLLVRRPRAAFNPRWTAAAFGRESGMQKVDSRAETGVGGGTGRVRRSDTSFPSARDLVSRPPFPQQSHNQDGQKGSAQKRKPGHLGYRPSRTARRERPAGFLSPILPPEISEWTAHDRRLDTLVIGPFRIAPAHRMSTSFLCLSSPWAGTRPGVTAGIHG
jgi:hypothetical protein